MRGVWFITYLLRHKTYGLFGLASKHALATGKAKSKPKGPASSQVLHKKHLLPSTIFTTARDLLLPAVRSKFSQKLPTCHSLCYVLVGSFSRFLSPSARRAAPKLLPGSRAAAEALLPAVEALLPHLSPSVRRTESALLLGSRAAAPAQCSSQQRRRRSSCTSPANTRTPLSVFPMTAPIWQPRTRPSPSGGLLGS